MPSIYYYKRKRNEMVEIEKQAGSIKFVGTYDPKKAFRLLAELYCRQEDYILEELTFASDEKEINADNSED